VVDTFLYLNYGNSSVTKSQENKTQVWDANYEGVWHFPNKATLAGKDSTANGNDATLFNPFGAVTGVIGDAVGFGTNYYIDFKNSASLNNWTAQTISLWVYAYPGISPYTTLIQKGANTEWTVMLNYAGDGGLDVQQLGGNTELIRGGFAVNSWTKVDITISPTYLVSLFVNGQLSFSGSVQSTAPTSTTGTLRLGNANGSFWAGSGFGGNVDELRVSNVVRSPDWITASYNSENSPATFYSVGPVETCAVVLSPASASLYAGQSQQFTPTVAGGNNAVTWNTPAAGALTASGLYTAPTTISAQQNVMITAASVGNPANSGSATVTLYPPVTVSILPPSAVVYPGQPLQFTANVANSANTAVTWASSPAGMGAIDPTTGIYTAPATITAQTTVTITATSQADSTKTTSVTITLSPAVPYSHTRAITIDHTKVAANQTNFPVLISGAYGFLANVANGGQVTNANGYDIYFAADAAGTARLDHEIESYDPATGTIAMWVRIPALSSTCDTVICKRLRIPSSQSRPLSRIFVS
jgi:hypothetical protein